MALQTSGEISIADIRSEFGAPSGTGLESFYRGGQYVPNTSVNSNVPTSGAIGLKDFYGAASSGVAFSGQFSYQYNFGSNTSASVYIRLGGSNTSGKGSYFYSYSSQFGGGANQITDVYDWHSDPSSVSNSDFDIYVSIVQTQGVNSTLGSFNQWLSLGSLRDFGGSVSSGGEGWMRLRVYIRPSGSGQTTSTAVSQIFDLGFNTLP